MSDKLERGLERGHCRGCKAEILWAHTARGRKMPLDPKPEIRVVIVKPLPGTTGLPHAQATTTYVAHFATCPQAEAFRRQIVGPVELDDAAGATEPEEATT